MNITTQKICIPQIIALDESSLKWDSPLKHVRFEDLPKEKNMLDRFVRLVEATEADILEFAKDYGVLGLCHHGLPCSHAPPVDSDELSPREPRPMSCMPVQTEHSEEWRWYAKGFQAALNAAVTLNAEKIVSQHDWETLKKSVMGWGSKESTTPVGRDDANYCYTALTAGRVADRGIDEVTIPRARLQLSRVLNGLLRLGNVAALAVSGKDQEWELIWEPRPVLDRMTVRPPSIPVVTDLADQLEQEVKSVNTFGYLAIQLLKEISRTDGLALCSSCGRAFPVAVRRRSSNRNAYCQSCGRAAAVRDAMRRYRAKTRGKEILKTKTI